MSKKEKAGLFIIILFVVLLGVGSLSIDHQKIGQDYLKIDKEENVQKENEIPVEKIDIKSSYEKAYLEIEGKKHAGEIIVGENVYDFMKRLKEKGKIEFTDKTYTGLGKFIESINGIKGNGSKYWIYYVNGEKAKVGVSEYKLNSGDVVSWRYENDLKN